MNKLKYFTAPWCGPCRLFKPIIADLVGEGYNIDIINIDEDESSAIDYDVMSIPHLVFEKDCSDPKEKDCSKEIYARITGGTSKENIKSLLTENQ